MKFANENHKKCEIYARLFGNYQNAIRVPVMGYGLWVMGYGLWGSGTFFFVNKGKYYAFLFKKQNNDIFFAIYLQMSKYFCIFAA